MSDLIIFLFGCLVSLIVAAAVAVLLWTAGREPASELVRVPVARADRRRVARDDSVASDGWAGTEAPNTR